MLSRAALVPSTAEHSSWSFSSFQWLASLVAQMVKNPPAMQETWVRPLDWGEGHGNPLQYCGLENSTDRGYSPWGHQGPTRLSNYTTTTTLQRG